MTKPQNWWKRAQMGAFAFGLALCLHLAGAAPVAAQDLNLPSTIDPTRIEIPEAPQESAPTFGFSLELLVPDSRRDLPEEEARDIIFQVGDIKIVGGTLYPEEAFRPFYEKLIGAEASLFDLYEVAAEIDRFYKTDGYFLSAAYVPAQRVSDDVFTIEVREGFINRVTLQGDVTDVHLLIQSYVDKLTQERPIKFSTVERYVLLVNDIPGVSTTQTFRQSSTEPGASQMVMNVEVDNFSGFHAIDNRGSKYAGPWSSTAGGTANSFTELGERVSFIVLMTQDWDEQRLGSLTYEQMLGAEGARMELQATYTTSELGSGAFKQPGGIEIRAKSFQASLEVRHPLIRSRTTNLELFGNFNWKYSTTFDDSPIRSQDTDFLLKDDVRTVTAGFQYDFIDPIGGANRLTFAAHQGLDILGARSRDKSDPEANANKRRSNALAPADSTRFEAEFSRVQRILDDFILLTEVKGQTTWDRLLGSEKFSYGGKQYGRGFDSGEIAGDRGLAMANELSWNKPINLTEEIGLANLRFYGFYDLGVTWNRILVEENNQAYFDVERLFRTSAGFGVSTDWEIGGGNHPIRFNVNIEYAKPLVGGRASDGERVGRDRRQTQAGDCCGDDRRWYINLVSHF